jgi:hypothetical protein
LSAGVGRMGSGSADAPTPSAAATTAQATNTPGRNILSPEIFRKGTPRPRPDNPV